MKTIKSALNLPVVAILVMMSTDAQAQRQQEPLPAPTHAAVSYGDHPSQVIDFWQAQGDGPRPLVVYIHGGGFTGGNKNSVGARRIDALREAGISVASVEYRLIGVAPLPAAHEDAVRAIQFIRSKAAEWGIDKTRIGATGGSAGAQLVAFLAWHDDFADPSSGDPVARESSRLSCVAPTGCQSTMDLNWWLENIPGYTIIHKDMEEAVEGSRIVKNAIIKEISVINHISSDDPPVYFQYGMAPGDPIPENNPRGWSVHHVNFGVAMSDKLKQAGVEVTLKYPGAKVNYNSDIEFLIDKLK